MHDAHAARDPPTSAVQPAPRCDLQRKAWLWCPAQRCNGDSGSPADSDLSSRMTPAQEDHVLQEEPVASTLHGILTQGSHATHDSSARTLVKDPATPVGQVAQLEAGNLEEAESPQARGIWVAEDELQHLLVVPAQPAFSSLQLLPRDGSIGSLHAQQIASLSKLDAPSSLSDSIFTLIIEHATDIGAAAGNVFAHLDFTATSAEHRERALARKRASEGNSQSPGPPTPVRCIPSPFSSETRLVRPSPIRHSAQSPPLYTYFKQKQVVPHQIVFKT
jgi:hypothetical protein